MQNWLTCGKKQKEAVDNHGWCGDRDRLPREHGREKGLRPCDAGHQSSATDWLTLLACAPSAALAASSSAGRNASACARRSPARTTYHGRAGQMDEAWDNTECQQRDAPTGSRTTQSAWWLGLFRHRRRHSRPSRLTLFYRAYKRLVPWFKIKREQDLVIY